MTENPAAIRRYDIVIIGGGIAGIAIAELLARKSAWRIKVLEQADKLGEGASGKLEGWFHTGALYSGSEDAQTFLNCVNALEDLVELYSHYFTRVCNFGLQERRPGVWTPTVIPQEDAWFTARPVQYILPREDSPDIKLSRLKSEAVLWNLQKQRMLARMEVVFAGRHNWQVAGRYHAPDPDFIEKSTEITGALLEPNAELEEMCARYDRSCGVEPSRYDFLQSSDVPMNPIRIMRDLVASALAHGVEFETGVQVEAFGSGNRRIGRLESVRYQDREGAPVHVRADLFICAVGSGFEQLAPLLKVRSDVRVHKSYTLVAYPALTEMNFARMSPNARYHFNHLHVVATGSRGPIRYSMLADSGYQAGRAETPEFVNCTDLLLELAQRYFGKEALYRRLLHVYECKKTEFIGDTEEERRYSYWIECDAARRCISVLPGKFSFFPTVAWQTYKKVKELLNPQDSSNASTPSYDASQQVKTAAAELVADHYPYRFLSKHAADPEHLQDRETERW